jgi:hypothetical protein
MLGASAQPIPPEEGLAIARIAERVTRLKPLKTEDAQWMATAAGISAFIPQGLIPTFERFLGTHTTRSSLSKSDLLQFLLSAYGGSAERFPRLLELVVKHALNRFGTSRVPGYVRKNPDMVKTRRAELEMNRRYLATCASILGLGLGVELGEDELDPLRVRLVREEIPGPRLAEKNRLHHVLEANYPDELKKLQGAYERLTSGGPDAYREAIESCRSAYEFFFRKLTAVDERVGWSTKLTEFFAETTFCDFVKHTYSYLSKAGAHSPRDREGPEALLAIRLTESVMVAALMGSGKW